MSAQATSATYRVRHTTRYTYDATVDHSYGRAFLSPRTTPHQQVLEHVLNCSPTPGDYSQHTDFYGNTSTFIHIEAHYEVLEVTALSRVQVADADLTGPALQATWEDCRDATLGADWDHGIPPEEFLAESPRVRLTPAVREFAEAAFAPGTSILECLQALTAAINSGFAYSSNTTTVSSTLDDLFTERAGVCQDFAHLAVAAARAKGLAARYVSGYLRTYPPAGEPRLIGADASHAWAAVLVPGFGWVDIDPTNNKFANHEFITTAWGRDYDDVPPLKGVVFAADSATSTLVVEVDVEPLDEA
ncbi:transglutaminase family protein [Micrococcales bacterium 31B]|nr:transglutaminase family protein [Micrococcales bacterium 31B]